MSQINQVARTSEQLRADRAKQVHLAHAPREKIPQFDPESADALLVSYSKPTPVPLSPVRAELFSLIQLRDEAAQTLATKKAALSKAAATVTKLRSDLDAVRRVVTEQAAAQAAALAASFENDTPAPAPAPANTVATLYFDEFQQQIDIAAGARDKLTADVKEAEAEHAKCQAQVVAAAFSVMRADGDAIAVEIETAQRRVDELRLHVGILNNFGGGFVVKIGDATKLERPQLLTARSISTLERPPEVQHPATQNPRVQIGEQWRSYFDALCLDASATFGS